MLAVVLALLVNCFGSAGEMALLLACDTLLSERCVLVYVWRTVRHTPTSNRHGIPDAAAAAAAGVLVLDRVNGVAYVALSERADKALAEQWVSTARRAGLY
jgi:hypothetical protein